MTKASRCLLWATGLLLAIGLVMVFSSSSYKSFHDVGYSYYWLRDQVLWLLISVCFLLLTYFIDYRKILKTWPFVFCFTVLGLLLVFEPHIGRSVHDSRRWIEIAGFRAQPSEFTKLTVIICIAGFLSCRRRTIKKFFFTFVPIFLGIVVCFGLILLEPDLGTSVYVLSLSVVLMLVAGIRVWYLGLTCILVSPAIALFAYLHWTKIVNRFSGMFGVGEQPSYQIQHSLAALGSGGWFGKGLGQGTEKFGYLPEPQTDFIFSILGEELGFVGCLVVLFLFAVFLFSGLQIARKAHDFGGFLLAFGATFSLVFQAVFNIAVVSKAAPTKGISLPFISYGGSGLLLALIEVGLILNVARIGEREGGATEFYVEEELDCDVEETEYDDVEEPEGEVVEKREEEVVEKPEKVEVVEEINEHV